MRVQLNIAQATAVIDRLELSTKLPSTALKEATLILKMAVQDEVQATESRLESMIIDLEEHGYREITTELVKVRNEIKLQGQKTEDKYFDEEGKIKEQK